MHKSAREHAHMHSFVVLHSVGIPCPRETTRIMLNGCLFELHESRQPQWSGWLSLYFETRLRLCVQLCVFVWSHSPSCREGRGKKRHIDREERLRGPKQQTSCLAAAINTVGKKWLEAFLFKVSSIRSILLLISFFGCSKPYLHFIFVLFAPQFSSHLSDSDAFDIHCLLLGCTSGSQLLRFHVSLLFMQRRGEGEAGV